jgi:hypothetical protein
MTIGRVTKVFANGWVELDPQIQNVQVKAGVEIPKDIAIMPRVPIGFFKAGGFVLTLPVAVGDEGLIIFSDRGLSVWKETGAKAPPRETHFHSLSDGVFVPFPTSKAGAIQNFDPTSLYAGVEDQSAYLQVSKGGLAKIFAGTKLTFDSPLTEFTGNTSTLGAAIVTGNLTTLANLAVQLIAQLQGAVTTGSTVTSAGAHHAPAFLTP